MNDLPDKQYIPSTIFYGSQFPELLYRTKHILRLNDFIPRVHELFSRMIAYRTTLTELLQKASHCYPDVFQNLVKSLGQ